METLNIIRLKIILPASIKNILSGVKFVQKSRGDGILSNVVASVWLAPLWEKYKLNDGPLHVYIIESQGIGKSYTLNLKKNSLKSPEISRLSNHKNTANTVPHAVLIILAGSSGPAVPLDTEQTLH